MNEFWIGKTVNTKDEYDRLPVGAVLSGGFGGGPFVKVADGSFFQNKPKGHTFGGLATNLASYTIVFLPEPEPVSEADVLALELRNAAIPERTHVSVDDTSNPRAWRNLAEFVRNNFTRNKPDPVKALPSKIIAGDDEVWTLRDNGKYSIQDPNGWFSRAEIEHYDGIKREIA